MSKQLVWSKRAAEDLTNLQNDFDKRNRSNLYSTKLMKAFRASAYFIEKYPMASLPTSDETVRGFVILHYILFFQIFEDQILLISVWDGRQNSAQFKNILKSI
jgi:hypothetical protein